MSRKTRIFFIITVCQFKLIFLHMSYFPVVEIELTFILNKFSMISVETFRKI